MMKLRINGLVKTFNVIRQQLAAGIAEKDRAHFRQKVISVVRQVEQICRQHGVTPDSLPGPSKKAFHFLKNLDMDNLPQPAKGDVLQPVGEVQIRNVVSLSKRFSTEMWLEKERLLADTQRYATLQRTLQQQVKTIDNLSKEQGLTPGHLPVPSRQAYSWLVFLSQRDNLRIHLKALATAQAVLAKISAGGPVQTVEIHLQNMRYLWRMQRSANRIILRGSEGFIHAPDAVWEEMIGSILNRRQNHPMTDQYIHSERFTGVIQELEAAVAAPQSRVRGHAHDLDEVFERVNRRYFNGKIARPNLHWNQTLTHGKMGHYHLLSDTIMLSVTLDHPEVPDFVVDFVMYHELLHKKHGVKQKDGRRYSHTSLFRAEEQRFPQYQKAVDFLNALGARQRHDKPAKPSLKQLFKKKRKSKKRK